MVQAPVAQVSNAVQALYSSPSSQHSAGPSRSSQEGAGPSILESAPSSVLSTCTPVQTEDMMLLGPTTACVRLLPLEVSTIDYERYFRIELTHIS